MASKVEICNMALSGLGSKQTIQDIDSEQSVEARTCRLHYDQALRTCLEYADWTFATTTATSALLSADPPGDWLYMYALPADYLKMIEILDSLGTRHRKPPKFTKAVNSGQRVILTDTESPVWRYVYLNEDPTMYTAAFIDALAANLASRVAMPLSRKLDLKREALQNYGKLVATAASLDANEQTYNEEPDYTAEWFQDRDYDDGETVLVTNSDGTISEIQGNL